MPVVAVHADHAGVWVRALHGMTHATWMPFAGAQSPTPELAYSDPATFAQSASWVPGWTIGVSFVVFTALALAVMCLGCVPPCRVKRPSRTGWYALVGAFGGLLVCLFVAHAVLFGDTLTAIATDTLHVADSVKAKYDQATGAVETLGVQADDSLAIAQELRALNATDGNAQADARLDEIIDQLSASGMTIDDLTDQVKHTIDIQSYIDDGDYYISMSKWSMIGWLCLYALIILAAAAIFTTRAVYMVQLPASSSLESRSKCYRCGASAVASVAALVFLGSFVTAAGLWTMATVNADICIEPYTYLNVLLNSGNATAASANDNDNIASFYANCNDAEGGPVNANIDQVYSRVDSARVNAIDVRDAVSAHPDAIILADALISNITAAAKTVNSTRELVDCRRVHEVSEELFDQLCDRFVGVAFWIAILSIALAPLLLVALIIVAIPLAGEEAQTPTEGNALLALPTNDARRM